MTGDGLSRGLSDMWRSVVLYLPSILVFLVILVVGYLLARLARTLTAKTLRRAGFDRAVQRGPAGRLLKPGAPSATDVCARLAFFVVLLFALQLAFGVFGPNPASELLNSLIAWLPQVFVGIVIVVVAAAVAGAAHDLILAVLGGLGYARVLAKAVAAVIVTLGVIAGLDQAGIATSVTRPLLITVLATVAGVIIVGVGGGLIRPMQQRWEGWLDRAASESAAIREQARAYAGERARQAAEEPRAAPPDPAGPVATPAVPADTDTGTGTDMGTAPLGADTPARTTDGLSGSRFPAQTRGTPDGAGLPSATEGAATEGAATRDDGAVRPPAVAAETFTDDDEELAWEARWAEAERRSREQDSDETQVITAPPPAAGDDERTTVLGSPSGEERTTVLGSPSGEEHTTVLGSPSSEEHTTALGSPSSEEHTTVLGSPSSEERTTDLHAADDEPTTSFSIAETTILTPGVRPQRPAPDDEATVPGLSTANEAEAETTAIVTAGPPADDTTVIRSPGPNSSVVIPENEPATEARPGPRNDGPS